MLIIEIKFSVKIYLFSFSALIFSSSSSTSPSRFCWSFFFSYADSEHSRRNSRVLFSGYCPHRHLFRLMTSETTSRSRNVVRVHDLLVLLHSRKSHFLFLSILLDFRLSWLFRISYARIHKIRLRPHNKWRHEYRRQKKKRANTKKQWVKTASNNSARFSYCNFPIFMWKRCCSL